MEGAAQLLCTVGQELGHVGKDDQADNRVFAEHVREDVRRTWPNCWPASGASLAISSASWARSNNSARRGKAWLGRARQGTARHGKAGFGVARHGEARHGAAWQCSARQGLAWQGKARLGATWRRDDGNGSD